MPTFSFTGVLLVTVVAFLAPIMASLIPLVRVPSLVLEVIAGIIIGPAGFGWVHIDLPLRVLSLLGLAFLLFLAGLEVEFDRLSGTPSAPSSGPLRSRWASRSSSDSASIVSGSCARRSSSRSF